MPFVEHVHNGHHIHARAAPVRRVHVVVQRDKADAVSGENVIDVLSDLNIGAAESRQIFDDDGVDLSVLGVVQKSFHGGALEICPRPAVAYVFVDDRAAVIRDIFAQNDALIVYRHRFARLFVVPRQAHVESRFVQLFLL